MNSRCVYINNNEFGQFLEHHVLVEKLQEKTAMLSECENKLWLLRQSHNRKVLRVRS